MRKKNSYLISALISLLVFLIIFLMVAIGPLRLDKLISEKIVSLQNPLMNEIFIFIAKFSEAIMVGFAGLVFLILFMQGRKKDSIILVFSLGLGFIVEKTIKFFFDRVRPELQLISEIENSFPSGHSVFAIILFSLIIYFYKDEIKSNLKRYLFIALNVFFILFIGFSRIYVNLHWFSDVLAGFALGFFVVNVFLSIMSPPKSF